MNFTPVPRPIGEHAEAVRHASLAFADALKHNANPYRGVEARIDVNALIPRLIELHLGENSAGPERPRTVDPFSALVGAATALGITIDRGSADWITEPPS